MDGETSAEWVCIEGFHLLDHLTRVASQRQIDIDSQERLLQRYGSGAGGGPETVWEVERAKLREQWRTEREDETLQHMYRAPLVSSARADVGDSELLPWLKCRSMFGDEVSDEELVDDRNHLAEAVRQSLEESVTLNCGTHSGFDTALLLAQEQDFVRKLLIRRVVEKESPYAFLLDKVERSREHFWATLDKWRVEELRPNTANAMREDFSPSFHERLKFVRFMEDIVRANTSSVGAGLDADLFDPADAAGGAFQVPAVVSRLFSLKQHHQASVVQAAVRRWLQRRRGRTWRAEAKKNRYTQAVRTLQACARAIGETKASRRQQASKIMQFHQARRIQRWYRRILRWRRIVRKGHKRNSKARAQEKRMLAAHFRNIKTSTRITAHLEKLVAGPDTAETVTHRRRLRQWVAVVTIQAFFRRVLACRRVVRRRHYIIVAQRTVRRWLARRVVQYKRLFYEHRARRVRERAWVMDRQRWQQSAELEDKLMVLQLFVHSELDKVEEEKVVEQKRFEKGWRCFNRDMTRYMLKQKAMKECWVEQTGSGTYFNTETGKSQKEHPHEHLARVRRKQERKRGLVMLQERVDILEDYQSQLRGGEERERRRLRAQIEEMVPANLHSLLQAIV